MGIEISQDGESCSFEHQGLWGYQPCWGNVELVDEADTWDGRIWIHACRGHSSVAFGGEYAPRPSPAIDKREKSELFRRLHAA